MNSSGVIWILVALFGLIFVALAWKKGNIGSNFKGIFYLGIVFTVLGLFERIRYKEWGLLPIGLIFLIVGWLKRKKWKKP